MSTTSRRRKSASRRGTLTEPGQNSPFRDRSVEENLDLFRRMKAGEFPNGARVLRAKIDMASGNINLRDPVLYRILHAHHPRTGDKWSIYPSYDYAHGQSDAIEGITHSICTLEFEDHRPLYEWLLDKLPVPSKPHQYEFARLNLTYTLLSKRVLTELVRGGHVAGWDDPRMPTIAGLKRRGVPPAAIREFVKRIGVAKANSVVDVGMLEFCIREDLNRTALRRMAVLRPLKVVIENYPEGQSEELEADQPSGRSRRRHPPHRVRPRALYRARRFHGKSAEEVLPAVARQRSAAALRLFHQMHATSSRTPPARSSNCAAPTIPRPRAATRPTAARSRPPCTGCRRRSRCRRKSASTTSCSSNPTPDAANFAADLNPQSLEILARRADRACDRRGQFDRSRCSSSGRAISCAITDSTPDRPVFNRTIGLRDTFAKEVGGKG